MRSSTIATFKKCIRLLPKYWRLVLCLLMPIILLPIIFINKAPSAKAGYLLLLLTTYLVLELLPIAAAILLTLLMIPTVGLATTSETAKYFMNDTMFLFLAVLIMAISIEEVNLHNRLALLALRAIGVSPSRLILGFLLISGFLSMWMSNFAVTLMILPISVAITKTLRPDEPTTPLKTSRRSSMNNHSRRSSINYRRRPSSTSAILPFSSEMLLDAIEERSADEAELDGENTKFLKIPSDHNEKRPSLVSFAGTLPPAILANEEANSDNLKKAFQLSIAFGANIGGMATCIGSYNNMLLRMTVEGTYGTNTEFNFLSFSLVAAPIVFGSLLVTWVLFCLVYIPGWLRSFNRLRPSSDAAILRTLDEKLRELGPVSDGEISVMVIFGSVIALWLTRDPKFVSGWQSLFSEEKFATDALPVLFGAVLLFVVPLDFKAFYNGMYEPLLQWKKVVARLPWEFVLFAGCMMALIKLCELYGLMEALGKLVPNLEAVPDIAVMLVISLIASVLSEVMGGGLIAAILLPIFANVAENNEVNPLYYMMAITLATQMVFLTPLSSFPTLIVYNSGTVQLKDIVKSGIGPKILCLALQMLSLEFLGRFVMDIKTFPPWAEDRLRLRTGGNSTGLNSTLVDGLNFTTTAFPNYGNFSG